MSIFLDAIKSNAYAIKELRNVQFDLAITEVFDLCGVGEYLFTSCR